MKILPAIDIKGGRCVRLIQGEMDKETVYNTDPVAQAKIWEAAGASIIHLVDLDGAIEGKPKNGPLIRRICESVSCPVQIGGGIRSRTTADNYFDAGVERIVLGTLLLKDPIESEKIVRSHPGKVLAGIDAKNGMATGDGWITTSATSAIELAERIELWPIAGIVFTDIARDGMMQGTNVAAISDMARASRLPLIASGGVSSLADLEALAAIPEVWGTIIGKALYTGAIDLAAVIKEFERGI